MKFLKIALTAAAIAGFASAASAQDSGAYVNIGVDAVEFEAFNLSGKVGYNINEYFGVEGQAAFGVVNDKITEDGEELEIGIDSTFGAFGIVRLPASENFDIFARAGYAFTQVGISSGPASVGLDFDGFAFGVGGQYMWDGLNGVRLEYTRYDNNFDTDSIDGLDAEDVEELNDLGFAADVISLSYVRKF